MQGIVMAGGAGSRLRPLTCDLPKPLVPLVNRPVMSYALDLLRELGIKDVGVTLQYLPDKIRYYYGSGDGLGLNMHYFVEETPLGTAGSVKNAEDFLQDTFVVISGDALTDFDLRPAIRFHREKKALATLVLTRVSVPLEYGVVITDNKGRVRKFYEKPGWSDVFSDNINTGIYILEPEVLSYIPKEKFFDFSKDLFPMLLENGLGMYGFSLDGYWCDIGDLNQYREAQYRLLSGDTKWAIGKGSQQSPGVIMGRNSRIDPQAKLIPPVVIGDDVFISAGAEIGPLTVIGSRTNIDGSASVKHSIIWPETVVKGGAAIRGAVIGRGAEIMPGARVFEGAAVGNEARVGARSTVKPGVLIWPGKEVMEEQTISVNMVWGNPVTRSDLGTPEQGVALGRALAGLWHSDTDALYLSTGSDLPYFQMLANAVAAGLQASGIMVFKTDNITVPLARFNIKQQGIPGCHLALGSNAEPEPIYFEADGALMGNNRQRKLNQLLQRQEFVLFPVNMWPAIEIKAPGVNSYLEKVSDFCGIYKEGKTIAVAGLQLPYWQQRFSELGHRIVFRETVAGANEALAAGDAEIGAEVSLNGENITLFISDNAEPIKMRLLQLLLSKIMIEYNDGGVVAVPVEIANNTEKMAARRGAEVVQTKASPASYWHRLMAQDITDRQPNLKQYYLWEDAYTQLLYICDYLSKTGMTAVELIRQLPARPVDEKMLPCPWEARGQVFRRLLELYPSHVTDTTDGVKVNYPQGWALAIPHVTRAEYRIVGEGDDMEAARTLTGELKEKISYILSQGS
ncbi:NTP transferase domain-containing protein [Metallumcola ferriviriculae]|uniref:NTP transferase domain-containing protein n=1 Tax=Metallumcola ferriviriculae TaxID=3039180 RepID=A0AAU0UU45_9FIRM|nr:NTP transferase domain-containing protein [Desulfitibacteraceae bacterium MK1]